MTIPAGYVPSSQGWYYDLDSGSGPFWLDSDGEMQTVGMAGKMFTDSNGPYARLRVDVGQTGFFAGRECYTFYEFSIPTGTSQTIKLTAPADIILQTFGANLAAAALRIGLYSGGTPSGTFSTALPIFRTNEMSTAGAHTPLVTMAHGGALSGGTLINVLTMTAGSNAQHSTEQSVTSENPLGIAAGTYHIVLTNTDGATATGVFRLRWEERQ
jgi:hypothetical protein